jgi:hypothetical protein
VRQADALVRSAKQSFRVVEKEYSAKLRLARSELGMWSDAGVAAARSQFWQQYAEGKRFAQRSTFYDVVFAVLNGRTGNDEPVINFVLNWIMVVATNFTTGLLSAMLGFIIGLPWLIYSFGASFASGGLFFLVASFCASAVTISYLGALWGTAAGTAYAAVKVASHQARLQAAREERARTIRGGGRAHAD